MPDSFGNPLPGEPNYMKNHAAGFPGQTGDTGDWKNLNDPYHKDPASDPYGQQYGMGDGSKFQADFNKTRGDIHQTVGNVWNSINGARDPNRVMVDPSGRSMGPNGAQQGQNRDMQMTLIQQLQDQAAGRGPSLAQMQLQKATDQNIGQAMALGASQRGAGQAGMLKGIQTQQAGIAQGMAGDSAIARLQEQMAARGQLGQQLDSSRGQDQAWAAQNVQNNQFNVQTTQQRAIEQAKLDQEREKLATEAASKRSPMGAIGGFMSAMSDENLKEEITPGDGKLYAFLDKLGSHEYKYKDAKHGEGRRISPMAQELEKTDEGKAFVFEAEDGKAVDYGKGFGTMLASQAALHKRLKKLEGGK